MRLFHIQSGVNSPNFTHLTDDKNFTLPWVLTWTKIKRVTINYGIECHISQNLLKLWYIHTSLQFKRNSNLIERSYHHGIHICKFAITKDKPKLPIELNSSYSNIASNLCQNPDKNVYLYMPCIQQLTLLTKHTTFVGKDSNSYKTEVGKFSEVLCDQFTTVCKLFL